MLLFFCKNLHNFCIFVSIILSGETYDIPGINPPASYKMAAQVGLLSHNIRIVGGHYNDLFEESFGARVLVGTMADDEKEYTGTSGMKFLVLNQHSHV